MGGRSLVECSWPQYDSNLRTVIQDLLADESLVDVTLVGKDRLSVKAHRLVLAASSSYFREVFGSCGGGNSSSSETIVMLPGVSSADLNSLMRYWYCGQLSAQKEQLPSLREIANTLHIRGLSRIIDAEVNKQQQESVSHPTESVVPSASFTSPSPQASDSSSPYYRTSGPRKRRRPSPNHVIETPTSIQPPIKSDIPGPSSTSVKCEEETYDSDEPEVITMEQPGYDMAGDSADNSYDATQYGNEYGDESGAGYYGEEGGTEDTGGGANEDSYMGEESQYDPAVDIHEGDQGSASSILPDATPQQQQEWAGNSSLTEPFERTLLKNQCSRCLHIFYDYANYSRHLRSSKCFGYEMWRCPLCGRNFSQVGNYRTHLIAAHGLPKDSPLMKRRTRYSVAKSEVGCS